MNKDVQKFLKEADQKDSPKGYIFIGIDPKTDHNLVTREDVNPYIAKFALEQVLKRLNQQINSFSEEDQALLQVDAEAKVEHVKVRNKDDLIKFLKSKGLWNDEADND